MSSQDGFLVCKSIASLFIPIFRCQIDVSYRSEQELLALASLEFGAQAKSGGTGKDCHEVGTPILRGLVSGSQDTVNTKV